MESNGNCEDGLSALSVDKQWVHVGEKLGKSWKEEERRKERGAWPVGRQIT